MPGARRRRIRCLAGAGGCERARAGLFGGRAVSGARQLDFPTVSRRRRAPDPLRSPRPIRGLHRRGLRARARTAPGGAQRSSRLPTGCGGSSKRGSGPPSRGLGRLGGGEGLSSPIECDREDVAAHPSPLSHGSRSPEPPARWDDERAAFDGRRPRAPRQLPLDEPATRGAGALRPGSRCALTQTRIPLESARFRS